MGYVTSAWERTEMRAKTSSDFKNSLEANGVCSQLGKSPSSNTSYNLSKWTQGNDFHYAMGLKTIGFGLASYQLSMATQTISNNR